MLVSAPRVGEHHGRAISDNPRWHVHSGRYRGIFGWQVLLFLSDGAWVSFSLIDLGKVFGYDWFFSPGSWLGLHWLLNKVPTALLLILFGYWILLAGDNVR